MGDNMLKCQQDNFQKGRDCAVAEAEAPRLFIRQDTFNTIYPATPCQNERFDQGEALYAMPVNGLREQRVALLRGHRTVGHIEGEGARALLQCLTQPGLPNLLRLRISEVAELSGIAFAAIEHGSSAITSESVTQ